MRFSTRIALAGSLAISLMVPAALAAFTPSASAESRPRFALLPSATPFDATEVRIAVQIEAKEQIKKKAKKIRVKRAEAARKRSINEMTLPTSGRVSASFGETSRYWSVRHTGIDFDANYGAPVKNLMKGTVIKTGYDGAYGYFVVVRTVRGGDIWYAHLSDIDVRTGQKVASGKQLGNVGSTGNSTGSHLHLEVRKNDYPVDPAQFLWGKNKGKISKMSIPDWAYGSNIAHLNDL